MLPMIFWCFREVSLSVNPEFLNALWVWHTGSIKKWNIALFRNTLSVNCDEILGKKECFNRQKKIFKKNLTVKIAVVTTVFVDETFLRRIFYRLSSNCESIITIKTFYNTLFFYKNNFIRTRASYLTKR